MTLEIPYPIYLLAIACGSIVWVKGLPFIYWIKLFIMTVKQRKEIKRLKPFDCESCLSFWGSLVYLLATSHTPAQAVACAIITYLFTTLVTKLV